MIRAIDLLSDIIHSYVKEHIKTKCISGTIHGVAQHLDGSMHFTMMATPPINVPGTTRLLPYRFQADADMAERILPYIGKRAWVTIPADGSNENRPAMEVAFFSNIEFSKTANFSL
jgi:hypothetical protein